MLPLISIVMPVYNAMPYLPEAVESILNQTYKNIELIAIDDGSSDGSKEYLSSLTDARMNVILHPQNKGQAEARNTGMAAARGKYIAFMDADDISMPQRIEKQVALMEKNPAIAICGCGVKEFGVRQRIHLPPASDFLLNALVIFKQVMPTHAATFRSDVDFGKQTALQYGEDLLFVNRIIFQYPASNVKEVLYHYRIHNESISFQVDRLFWDRKLYSILIEERMGFKPTEKQVNAHLAWLSGNLSLSSPKDIILYLAYALFYGRYTLSEKTVLAGYIMGSTVYRACRKLYKRLFGVRPH